MYDVYKQEIRCFASCSNLVSSVYFDTNYCTSGKAKGPCKMVYLHAFLNVFLGVIVVVIIW